MRAEYQRQLKAGVAEAEAQQAAAEKAYTESADAAAAAGEEAPLRVAVKLSGIPRGGKIKPLRRRLGEIFGEVAPVEYVDYGVSNSGDPTVGYVRMKTAIGAAEAVRILAGRGVTLEGAAVAIELLTGATLRSYLQRIGEIKAKTAGTRRQKRQKWWDRKYGKAADGGAGAPAEAAGETGDEGEGEGEGETGGKRQREEEAAGGGEAAAKRARAEGGAEATAETI